MLNIFNTLNFEFISVTKQIAHDCQINFDDDSLKNFSVEPIKDKKFGDVACNIAMVLNKKFSDSRFNNVSLLANEIARRIQEKDLQQTLLATNSINLKIIKKIEIAKAGFINIFFEDKIWHLILSQVVNCDKIELPNLGNSQKVNLEYASPNPTGPIHVGHTRGSIYGDVLANLLKKVGYDVVKEYYINDAGAQISTLLRSVFLRYQQACGKEITIGEGLYPGEYLIALGQIIHNNFQDKLLDLNEEQYFPLIRDMVVDYMVNLIKQDLLALGIQHDNYFSEKKQLHDSNKIPYAIDLLKRKNLIYIGKLEIPKTTKGVGQIDDEYENNEQTLFRSTLFGDDQDRVVIKADGSYTYFAADIAYALSKFERGAKIIIMPLGYDHAGYIKRLDAVVKSITDEQAHLKVILCQMVKFVKDGQPLKMSKRAGNFITANQVIEEVGADVLRFLMLCRKNDTPFDFDLSKVVEQSKDNPIFYVQYAHARCCSILKNAQEIFNKNFDDQQIFKDQCQKNIAFLEILNDQGELEILKKIASFLRIIEMSTQHFEPHRLAFYLQELASDFHTQWHRGSENEQLKFIIKDNYQLTLARLFMVSAVKKIIATTLEIFNILACNEMK
jgi:arginyl-tRNA synthetase